MGVTLKYISQQLNWAAETTVEILKADLFADPNWDFIETSTRKLFLTLAEDGNCTKSNLDFVRSSTIDLAEQKLGHSPNWFFIRRRLLGVFGTSYGLEAKLTNYLSNDDSFSEDQ